ncbi:FtsK/SpoIIIE domain-containing protein [Cellulomonas iranensis]|uniref:FtsK/SpoIIIE domain-containing protein n=1 Tax=Cellulomonas iranensis TaxID=76862 RepID=UPI003D7D30F4
MRTRLLLRRPDGVTTPVVLGADTVTTVGDVADTLVRADPRLGGPPGEVELHVADVGSPDLRPLPRSTVVADAGLRPGSTVAVARSARRFVRPDATLADAAARLVVLDGPDAGTEALLAPGVSTIGRGRDATVRLTDRTVSQRHARVVVTDDVEIVDNGSANGVLVDGGLVTRTTVGPQDVVRLGDTTLRLERLRTAATAHGGAVVPFNRPPLVVPRYADRTVEAPSPPEPPKPQRFPWLAMLAPAVLGVALFLLTHNPLTLAFVGLSPLLLLGSWLDRRTGERARVRTQTAQFRTDLDRLAAQVRVDHEEEVATRLREHPATTEAVGAALGLSPVLWCRRPDDEDFLSVRLGTGTAASRTTIRTPSRGQADGALWDDLERTVAGLTDVAGVPLVARLRDVGGLGVAGAPQHAEAVARGLVAQLVSLHSPAELVVAAVASPRSARTWEWLTWLPHTASPHSPLGLHLGDNAASGTAVVAGLEELVAARTAQRRGGRALPAVLLVVEDDAPVERGRLVRIAEDGPAAGVHVLWCAPLLPRLPAACRTFLLCTDTGVRAGAVTDRTWHDVLAEPVDDETTAALALHLAGVVDAGAPVEDESDLPRTVGFLTLTGPELADDPQAVVARWRETGSLVDRTAPPTPRRADATLRAVLGQGVAGELVLDLRRDGPHALVGGTTGSGKSEFLQAWVLATATAHSPDRVTFLFVDYKGGAAFADCVELPHCVGLVTDLTPHLVRRALTSLRAELRRREHLLQRKKAKDLLSLERTGDPETPPALVIVVDEFAALVSEVPEFVDGVVDVAQRGRSLGLHLILATQRPAGVIKDNLRANTNLRIALRTADEQDSTDVLGSPVSAHFDPAVPGRGAVRTGPGRIALFQSAYVGGRSAVAATGTVEVESLRFGPGEAWVVPAPEQAPDGPEGPTDIARVVATVSRAAQAAGVAPPRRPWLPDLRAVYDLAELPVIDDATLPLGVVDLPEEQRQATHPYRPDDGALVLYGTGGSGTSTALRSIAVAAGRACAAGHPVRVYGLDLGAGGLAMLDPLPHVGSVVDGSDTERVTRLVRTLLDTVEERAARYAQARAGSITQYRSLTGRHDEPRVLLLVDGLSAFRDAWESEPGRAATFAAFRRVVSEGRPLGVHVVMAAERPGALPTALAGSVPQRIVLRQADDSSYGVLDVPDDVLSPASPPGRAVPVGTNHELQLAVEGGTQDPAEQAEHIARLAERLRTAGVADAPAVRRLPAVVAQSSLPTAVDGRPVLGVADDTLAPVGFDPHGSFLLAGLPGSGRTTVLTALATSLRRFAPDGRLYYVGNRRSPVRAADVWTDVAVSPDEAATLARSLLPDLAEPATGALGVVLVVESLNDLLGTPAEQPLTEAVRAARRNDHLVVAEAETSAWGSSWQLVAEVRNGRRGLVLQPDHLDGDPLFRTPFPRMARSEFPPGRGVVVESGRIRRVQVPLPDPDAWPLTPRPDHHLQGADR